MITNIVISYARDIIGMPRLKPGNKRKAYEVVSPPALLCYSIILKYAESIMIQQKCWEEVAIISLSLYHL